MSLVNGTFWSQHDLHITQNQMHPFFRPVEKDVVSAPPKSYPSLDQQNLPKAAGVDVETSSLNGIVVSPAMQSNEQSHLSNSNPKYSTQPQPSDSLMIEFYDPIGDRRKRRKVSIERDGEGSQSRDEVLSSNELNGPKGFELEQPDDGNVPRASADVSPSIPSTPKRRRGRPPRSSLSGTQTRKENVLQHENGDEVPENHSAAAELSSSKAKRTPRKQNLKIKADGTLSHGSPPKPKQHSPRSVAGEKPNKTTRGKSLALKNGKFTQSLIVKIKYNDKVRTSETVKQILSRPAAATATSSETEIKRTRGESYKSTHPFFLAKQELRHANNTTESSAATAKQHTSEDNKHDDVKKPVAWKDLVFSSKRSASSKSLCPQIPLWPPNDFHHIGLARQQPTQFSVKPSQREKQKSRVYNDNIDVENENVLEMFTRQLLSPNLARTDLRCPQRLHCTAEEAFRQHLEQAQSDNDIPILASARSKALHSTSAFDRAEASGPLPWTQKYCPTSYEEVLQPSCGTLYEWLRSLAVHNVKQGVEKTSSKRGLKKKKKLKKKDDELYDFIVDDEDEEEDKKIKNAILITGPNGCGKTASVFAVAKQLGFEVFEIHAGMRRSQKDIYDKVGDMAQNHMVQRGPATSRDSSVIPDAEAPEELNQPSLTSFLAPPGGKPSNNQSRQATPQAQKEQKQSLILFEEVDQIFDEDRGFWSGVLSLIENSKRPVVLTCNSPANIPFEELELYATLTYSPPSPDLAVGYLRYIAAAEGHLIDHEPIKSLYLSKHNDLRATITELDFWCQMTVGSTRGGLDWYPQYISRSLNGSQRPRTFSKDTFVEGLDLFPSSSDDTEANLRFIDECLQITVDDWLDRTNDNYISAKPASKLQVLHRSELLSDITILHSSIQPLLANKMCEADLAVAPDHGWIVKTKTSSTTPHVTQDHSHLFDCLLPLNLEKPTFPPAQGRLAPSLDSSRTILAADIAPYVRSICAFDVRLEQEREETFSSQGKNTRMTKAARAAAEGGDKASTRRDRWFPSALNPKEVLRTGNSWPQWIYDDPPQKDAMDINQIETPEETAHEKPIQQ